MPILENGDNRARYIDEEQNAPVAREALDAVKNALRVAIAKTLNLKDGVKEPLEMNENAPKLSQSDIRNVLAQALAPLEKYDSRMMFGPNSNASIFDIQHDIQTMMLYFTSPELRYAFDYSDNEPGDIILTLNSAPDNNGKVTRVSFSLSSQKHETMRPDGTMKKVTAPVLVTKYSTL